MSKFNIKVELVKQSPKPARVKQTRSVSKSLKLDNVFSAFNLAIRLSGEHSLASECIQSITIVRL